jgi:hypothetical protein
LFFALSEVLTTVPFLVDLRNGTPLPPKKRS